MVTIPESTFWSIVVLCVISLLGLGATALRNRATIDTLKDTKQDKARCVEAHGDIRVELVAMSKDIEALARAAGIQPQPSPARNGGSGRPQSKRPGG